MSVGMQRFGVAGWQQGSSDGESSEEELPRGRQEGPEGNEEWDEEREQNERVDEDYHFHKQAAAGC